MLYFSRLVVENFMRKSNKISCLVLGGSLSTVAYSILALSTCVNFVDRSQPMGFVESVGDWG